MSSSSKILLLHSSMSNNNNLMTEYITVEPGPDLQRRAVLRERRAEEGVDGVKHHVDDVFLQDGIGQTFVSFVTNLQKKHKRSDKHITHKHKHNDCK